MITATQRLQDAARSLMGPGVAVCGVEIGANPAPLYPEEEVAIARAVASRRAEFAAGRQAARGAMRALGVAPTPIPMGESRAPVWPAGMTGTITHAGGLALAALARCEAAEGLGLDLEADTPLARDLWPGILVQSERDWLASQPATAQGKLAKRIFSAKEAAYKAQYVRSGEILDFSDISVAYTGECGAFSARFMRAVPPFGTGDALGGRQVSEAGMILSVVRL